MTYQSSNLSAEEHLRLTGTVPVPMIEELIDMAAAADMSDVAGYIREARHPFSAEDFLAKLTSDLHALAKRLRGDNRDEVTRIAAAMEELQQEVFNSMEYADEQLCNALRACGHNIDTKDKGK